MSHLSKVLGIFRIEIFALFGGSREDNLHLQLPITDPWDCYSLPTWMVDFYGNIIHGSYVLLLERGTTQYIHPKKMLGMGIFASISAIFLILPCR